MADTALLVVDMLNAYRHPDADVLAEIVAEIVDLVGAALEGARPEGGAHRSGHRAVHPLQRTGRLRAPLLGGGPHHTHCGATVFATN
jgi:hypothetical protein